MGLPKGGSRARAPDEDVHHMTAPPRPRRRLAASVAALALGGAVAPATVSGAISFYVARDMSGGQVASHPSTRLWGTNYFANVSGNATTRLWTYLPVQGRYGNDTGKTYGPLMLRAPVSLTATLWCQNWGSRTISEARCYGSY